MYYTHVHNQAQPTESLHALQNPSSELNSHGFHPLQRQSERRTRAVYMYNCDMSVNGSRRHYRHYAPVSQASTISHFRSKGENAPFSGVPVPHKLCLSMDATTKLVVSQPTLNNCSNALQFNNALKDQNVNFYRLCLWLWHH